MKKVELAVFLFAGFVVHGSGEESSPLRPTLMERPVPAAKSRLSALAQQFTL